MSDEITPILSAVNGRAIANLVPQDEKTFIVDAVTGQKIAVIDGFFGGGGKAKIMTTEERTAITPEEGQMIFDSTLGALFVGDGATPGGTAVGGGEDDVPGYRLDSDGEFLNFNPISDIINVTGSTVTLEPDKAYKIVTTNGAVNITANPPAANKWGYEGHAEIFVGATGYAVFDTSKIVLANQLEPDSVNNCTLRFHDGMCYVSVEDHIAGYIVVAATGTTAGTLPYGITSATQEYIAFDATTNGATVSLSGATASAEKHIVGNGYTETTLTGAVDCGTSKFTVANLALQNVVVSGGTMTLGNTYIPSGSTVAVSGGELAVEKVTGAGSDSVIDLGGTTRLRPTIPAAVSGVTITNGKTPASTGWGANGGAVNINTANANATFVDCVISGNHTSRNGAIAISGSYISATFSGCSIYGNTADVGAETAYITGGGTMVLADSYADKMLSLYAGGNLIIKGQTKVNSVAAGTGDNAGSVTISSGAVLDLTGNTNATPINPRGGITFEQGGATIYPSAGSASAITIGGGTFTAITNGGVLVGPMNTTNNEVISGNATVNLSGTNIPVSQYKRLKLNGLTFTGGSAAYGGVAGKVDTQYFIDSAFGCTFSANSCTSRGGAFALYAGANAYFIGCSFVGNSAGALGGAIHLQNGCSATISACTFSGNMASGAPNAINLTNQNKLNIAGGCVFSAGQPVTLAGSGGSVTLRGSNVIDLISGMAGVSGTVVISSGASINLTSSINPGGGITVLEGGCTVNGNAIPAGTYTSIDSNGQPT